MMTVYPPNTGEFLAQTCLDAASGDYSREADALMAMPSGPQRDDAMAALALWSAYWPIATTTIDRYS